MKLPLNIVKEIAIHASYFDTLKLYSLNSELLDVLKDGEIWKHKKIPISGKIEITHDLYATFTDNVGGRAFEWKNLNTVIASYFPFETVAWVLSSEGEVFSLSLLDKDEIWIRTTINVPVSFLRINYADDSGNNVYAVTENNEIYNIKSFNRGVDLFPKPPLLEEEEVVDLTSNSNGGLIIRTSNAFYSFDTKQQIWKKIKSSAVLLYEGLQIKNIIEKDDHYILKSDHEEEIKVEKYANLIGLDIPDSTYIKKVKVHELSLTPFKIQSITLANARRFPSDYDLENQHDIIQEFYDTNQGLREGIDTT